MSANKSSQDYTYDVFVSYSHVDSEWVWDWLVPRLKRAGLTVCTDRENFDPGVPSLVNMENAIFASRHTLLVLTSAWVQSEWTCYEALLTQSEDPVGLRQRALPVLREPCDLPPRIAMLTYLDFTGRSDIDLEWGRLLDALRGVRRLSAARLAPISNPQSDAREHPVRRQAKPEQQVHTAFGIPPTLYGRLRQVLLDCGPFDSDGRLRAIFADDRLNPWQGSLPQAKSSVERVERAISHLHTRRSSKYDENVLVLFVQALYERINPGDACHQRLRELASELRMSLTSKDLEQSSFREQAGLPQRGDLQLLAFDTSTQELVSQIDFSIPPSVRGQKKAYSIAFYLFLVNRESVMVRDLLVQMHLESDTDFFLAYSYGDSTPLTIVDSPSTWRISPSYDRCEFEGGVDFVCHSNDQRCLGLVRILVPYGQAETTMTFHYQIRTEKYESRGTFAILLRPEARVRG